MTNKFMEKLHVFQFGCEVTPKGSSVDCLVVSLTATGEELQVTKSHLYSPASIDGSSCS